MFEDESQRRALELFETLKEAINSEIDYNPVSKLECALALNLLIYSLFEDSFTEEEIRPAAINLILDTLQNFT